MSNGGGGGSGWKSFLAGALSTALGLAIIQVGLFYFYYNPGLVFQQQQLDQQREALGKQERATKAAEDALALTKQQRDDAIAQRDQQQKMLNDLRQKWQAARNKFILDVDRDIRDAMTPPPPAPVLEPGQRPSPAAPRPTVVEIARRLVADRDAAREQLLQIKDNVQRIYDRLDKEIDILAMKLRQQPPPTDEEIRELVRELEAHWKEKITDVNETAENILRSLGCPEPGL
jgi:hypothetical protein